MCDYHGRQVAATNAIKVLRVLEYRSMKSDFNQTGK